MMFSMNSRFITSLAGTLLGLGTMANAQSTDVTFDPKTLKDIFTVEDVLPAGQDKYVAHFSKDGGSELIGGEKVTLYFTEKPDSTGQVDHILTANEVTSAIALKKLSMIETEDTSYHSGLIMGKYYGMKGVYSKNSEWENAEQMVGRPEFLSQEKAVEQTVGRIFVLKP